ncbi:aminotransferase class I/II-fold pyridoxal phosphate-dependent enzyme [Shouchella clausii]|nr:MULTISPECIES: aminotransferase class I/II-fold pyridoxal phosphate-dependent enzyme [Shouchella]MCM3314118.1 aminotransferase class I/II-fold pyridoxal phosphate-dependent enzyme [Psychrobacillus sp. MER TA 17]ALA52095.1 Aspartate transaminase [Shouchella clausii]MBU3230458.1 aminotransferase class I/II-fold pyridoxal phosphate-dependent enzyme [Shouchella clausii]MBU3262343.1 aminotransferase class I/II-fold pyridoxal phosphate-dependent enzyme [Shouchella clausii]MBU3507342.1 aminotransfe
MSDLKNLSTAELELRKEELEKQYNMYKMENIQLDMSRGKPGPEQLDLSHGLLRALSEEDVKATHNGDIRNYGQLDGIPEAKALFGELLGVQASNVFVGGNSSLSLMHDAVARAVLFGTGEGQTPWGKLPKVKFLCPSPGYDRHFAICELFNIDMIVVNMTAEGPDMDQVEALVANDETIKGIWCVPKYSNPSGVTYSNETVQRLAALKTKAEDFRIFWDNAYAFHHLTDTPDELADIFAACAQAGYPDRVYMFASTSKVTFPGAGISAFVSSEANLAYAKKQLSVQTIGYDKINQLRHVRFFEQIGGVGELMKQHAQLIKPKFDQVNRTLTEELGGKGIAEWSEPQGGYFISLDTLDGCAKRVVSLAREAGVILTGAGATFPYGKDPRDRNIRIAPTFPSVEELKKAMEVVSVCVELASVEKLLAA